MYTAKKRYGSDPTIVERSKNATFYLPITMRRNGKLRWESGQKIFVCSWSDFFHPDADEWRSAAWEIIKQRPDLVFQILTKRPQFIASRLPPDWDKGWKNVWLGITGENQKSFSTRWRKLQPIPAVLRFVSFEPLLESISIDHELLTSIDWVIIGSESGPGARHMKESWVRDIVHQCKEKEFDIPVFYKQKLSMKGKKITLPSLNGKIYSEFPISGFSPGHKYNQTNEKKRRNK